MTDALQLKRVGERSLTDSNQLRGCSIRCRPYSPPVLLGLGLYEAVNEHESCILPQIAAILNCHSEIRERSKGAPLTWLKN